MDLVETSIMLSAESGSQPTLKKHLKVSFHLNAKKELLWAGDPTSGTQLVLRQW